MTQSGLTDNDKRTYWNYWFTDYSTNFGY
jgi:hypothetical protein